LAPKWSEAGGKWKKRITKGMMVSGLASGSVMEEEKEEDKKGTRAIKSTRL
jgi:hypothetical protein